MTIRLMLYRPMLVTMPARMEGTPSLLDAFLNAEFEGGRHQKRVDKITALENR